VDLRLLCCNITTCRNHAAKLEKPLQEMRANERIDGDRTTRVRLCENILARIDAPV
jgi:hypothetical protein